MSPLVRSVAGAAIVLALGACRAPSPVAAPAEGLQTLHLGEHFDTPKGNVFVVRVQDEYRLIRCIPTGPIAGCYEDILSLPSDGLTWNEWVDVEAVPGLSMTFLSPIDVAVRMNEPDEPDEASEAILAK